MPTATQVCRTECAYCHEHFETTNLAYTHLGQWACSRCWLQYSFQCDRCGAIAPRNGRLFRDRQTVCRECTETETWDPSPSGISIASYAKIVSKRKFGVELETSLSADYRSLKGQTLFGAKYDCSVSGMEFISPILYGDEGLEEVEFFCDLASDKAFDVDDNCGYHLHLDVRDETTVQLRHIAYAYAKSYAAWRNLVSSYRANDCNYCHAPSYSASSIKTCRRIKDFMARTDRYNYLNLYAFERLGTVEVRLHDASLHAKTINYWVIAHTRFIDAVHDMTYAEIDALFDGDAGSQFNELCRIWDMAGGQRISEFYRRRVHEHGAPRPYDEDCDDDED